MDGTTVPALRYPVWVSTGDKYGSGSFRDELYFPHEGLRVTCSTDWSVGEDGEFRGHLEVQEGEIGNRYRGHQPIQLYRGEIDELQPTEEVRVPASLAVRLFALSRAPSASRDVSVALGEAAVRARVLRRTVRGEPGADRPLYVQ